MPLDYGFKISQLGYDVKTATDQQLIFSSKLNALKNYIIGTATITIPANTPAVTLFTVTYTHSLGFVPAIFAYPNDGTYAAPILCIPPDLGSGYANPETPVVDNCQFSYDLTSTYIKFYLRTYDTATTNKFWGANPQYTITFKIYIFTQQIG